MILLYMVCGYYVILAPGNLYNDLVSENWKMFRADIISFTMWATAVLTVKVIRGVLREASANLLRKRLTDAIHGLYFGEADHEMGYGASPYYRLITERKVDNPDQRIVADAREFSSSFFNILAGGSAQGADTGGMLEAAASVLFYSYKTLLRTGWYGVLIAYAWSFIVGIGSIFVINRTSPVVFHQERLEADFRYGHAELRRCAEEVAFMRGGPFEKRKMSERLDKAVGNKWTVISRHFFLNLVQYGFSYYVSLVMYLAIALAVHTNVFANSGTSFSSQMTPGEKAQWVAQTGGIFIQLLFSFTMVIQLGTAISSFVTNANRVSSIIDELDEGCRGSGYTPHPEEQEPLMEQRDGLVVSDVSEGIAAQNLCLRPSAATKIGPVSFSVRKGQWVLIQGRTGSGKSSILRALRGLWAPVAGTMQMPTDDGALMFIPQVPYIPCGNCTLRELVMYPDCTAGSEQEAERVASALRAVGWKRGDSRRVLDVQEDWSVRLSPGEAQLLAAARVLVKRPVYAVMDEPTSSLDRASEERVFSALKESGVSALTVGHGQALPALHDTVISIEHLSEADQRQHGDESWT